MTDESTGENGTAPSVIVDLFAGPGGWSEGLAMLGLADVGIEWDAAACATRRAAGHPTIRTDVESYPCEPFAGKTWGLIASPPCPDFSAAGKRAGIDGPSGRLIRQVPRWVEALRPEWVACEQVPGALPYWKMYAHQFEQFGYVTWVGLLCAADYGVPQTRTRAFLLASRSGFSPPEPTHAQTPGTALFGQLRPWVSMADALGWPECWATGHETARGSGMRERHGVRRIPTAAEPSQVVTSKTRSWTVFRSGQSVNGGPRAERLLSEPAVTITGRADLNEWVFRTGAQERATVRRLDEPAPTILASADNGDSRWMLTSPATTVAGDPRIMARCHHDEGSQGANAKTTDQVRAGDYDGTEPVKLTPTEALILQSFRPDYPLQGTRTKQFEQIGNAVPPLLAAHVLSAVTRSDVGGGLDDRF